MQGAVWLLCNLQSLLCNASEYTGGLQRCSEKCGVQYARSYSDSGHQPEYPSVRQVLSGFISLGLSVIRVSSHCLLTLSWDWRIGDLVDFHWKLENPTILCVFIHYPS